MIWKVLKSNIKTSQLAGAFIGVLCGLSLLMGSLLFYLDVRTIFQDKEGFWKDEYIVVNKNIHLSDSFRQFTDDDSSSSFFTEEEIEDLRKKSFVNDIAQFTPGTFSVRVFTERNSLLPGLYTDLFFEAVPDDYVDVNYDDWFWQEDMKFVPCILPRAYLNLYNFGFAQSQNLPQIAEDGAGVIKFNLVIYGQDKRAEFETRIVGFSDRINTFLVPLSFVEWGNKNFGSEELPKTGRLIVITNDPSNPEMINYFEEKDYVVSKSLLSNTKALKFLKAITIIVLSIGLIIILLAFWLMLISVLLLLERNHENISKLSLLGYTLKQISKPYTNLIIILLSSMFLSSLIPLIIFRKIYSAMISSIGYITDSSNILTVALPVMIFCIFLTIYLLVYMKSEVKRMIKHS